MKRATFTSLEDSTTQTILIVDKTGVLGKSLALSVSSKMPSWKILFATTNHETKELWEKGIEILSFHRGALKVPSQHFSTIVVCFNGEEDIREALPQFIAKAKEDNAQFIFILSRVFYEDTELISKILEYQYSQIFFLGDLFGTEVPFDTSLPLYRFIDEAKRRGTLYVQNMGLQTTYPVSLEDSVDGIIKTVFGEDKRGVFFLFPLHNPTELSLAWTLHKINPSLKIDFVKEQETKPEIILSGGTHVIENPYPLAKKIAPLMNYFSEKKKGSDKNVYFSPVQTPTKRISQTKKSLVSFFGIFIVSLIILPIVSCVLFLVLGFFNLASSRTPASFSFSKTLFHVAYRSSSFSAFEFSFVNATRFIQPLQDISLFGEKIAKTGEDGLTGVTFLESVLKGTAKDPEENILKGTSLLKNALASYKQLLESDSMPGFLIVNIQGNIKKINNLPFVESLFSNTVDALPGILGIRGEKKYLLLFQNNAELRPGGGFIGSYGIVSLKKGKITDFSIHDVYDADGQLKAHVEPPFAVRRYLPSVHWYLRDSNFDVDFAKSSSDSARLLNLETGDRVDGVVGITAEVVRKIVGALGGVFVSDYNETVTADTFYDILEKHAQKDFFPGSTQKKDFLTLFFVALQEKLRDKNSFSLELLRVINQSLAEKQIQFAFSIPGLQNSIEAGGFSSAVKETRKEGEGIINDFLYISEANIGVNKVNRFIKRKIVQSLVVNTDGMLSKKTSILYKNTGEQNGKPYKSYIRFVVPVDSTISSIRINGKEQLLVQAVTDPAVYESKTFKKPEGLEVEEYEENGRKVYGFLIQIPTNTFYSIDITYEPITIAKQTPILYSQKFLKQSGTIDDQITTRFTLDKGTFTNVPKDMQTKGNSVEYTGQFSEDKNFQFSFIAQ